MTVTKIAANAEPDLQPAPVQSAALDLQGLEAPVEVAEIQGGPSAARASRTLQRAYGNQFVQRLSAGRTIQGQRASGAGAEGGAVSPVVERRIDRERGNGQPLPDTTRGSMQRSLGADFSGVRVHTGAEATKLNRSLGARAFTTGTDIFFAEGEYAPGNDDGDRLLAHELTHVVQQGGAPSAGAQTKMDVNAADDDLEREADATAERVVSRKDEDESEEARLTSASGATQLSRQASLIQREEEIADASSEDELRQAEEEEESAGGSTEEKAELEDDTKRARETGAAEGQQQGAQAGGAANAESGVPTAEDASMAPENVPDIADAPEEPIPHVETRTADDLEADQDAGQEQARANAEETAASKDWAATMPPDWDMEMVAYQAFAAAMEGGPGTNPEAAAAAIMPKRLANLKRDADAGRPPTIQRDGTPPVVETPAPAEAPAGPQKPWVEDPETGSYSASDFPYQPDAKEDLVVDTPKVDDPFGQVFVGDVAGKGAQMVNSFAGIGKETNGFGVTAALLESLVLVTELVTNILGYISLALIIVAGILYALGATLVASLFGAAAGAAFIAAATSIMAGPVVLLGNAIFYITLARLAMRVLVIAFRGFDYLYAKYAQNATEAELKAKERAMIGQTMGFAIDGVSVLLAGGPTKVLRSTPAGTIVTASATGPVVSAASTKIATGLAVKGAVVGAKTGANAAARAEDPDLPDAPGLVEPDAVEDAGAGAGMPEVDAQLPAPPMDAPVIVQGTAFQIAGAQQERQELLLRVATTEETLTKKQQWDQDMTTARGELASEKATLAATDQMRAERIANAEAFIETAGEAAGPASEAQSNFGEAGGTLSSGKGQIESGMRRAESEGAGGAVDKNTADRGPDAGKDGAVQAGSQIAEGASAATASKAENQAIQEESGEAQDQIEQSTQDVGAAQDQNRAEMELLQQDREA
ncbi:MAG TPA: DUF4157 domain-containing protein [Chloroflexota bacterium]|nr:DUF4157 domain-containing protein [Chloroflexota bacterium]